MIQATGGSLRQSLLAAAMGTALSIGMGALISRTLVGVPARPVDPQRRAGLVVVAVARMIWASVALWVLALASADVVIRTGGVVSSARPLVEFGAAVVGVVVAVSAVLARETVERATRRGRRAAARIVAWTGAVIVLGMAVVIVPMLLRRVDITTALTLPDGPWSTVWTGSLAVACITAPLWRPAHRTRAGMVDGSDVGPRPTALARVVVVASSAFVMAVLGVLLTASDPTVAGGLLTRPLSTAVAIVPDRMAVPLAVSVAVSLITLVGTAVSLSARDVVTGSPGEIDTGTRPFVVVLVGATMVTLTAILIAAGGDPAQVVRDLVGAVAVPVVGVLVMSWSSRRVSRMFAADHEARAAGVPTIVGIVAVVVLGWGFTSSRVEWLEWQGYLFGVVGIPVDSAVASADPGILVAAIVGAVVGGLLALRPSR